MATGQEAFDIHEDAPPWRRAIPLILAMLLAAALGLILFLADRASEQRERAIGWQRHSFEVMMLAEQLEGTIANAEGLLGRYVVSLDQDIGRQFQAEWRKANAELNALGRATRNNPAQQANLRALREAIGKRGETLNDIALRTTYKQRLGALSRFYEAGRAPTIAAVRDALQRTIAQERSELERRTAQVDRSEQRVSLVNGSYAMLGATLLAAALLALWFAYGALRERRFEQRLAQAELARVDGLEHAVRLRTEELQAANAKLRREMEERAQAEQGLRQLQKMEAIGKLTGGIAHDFNNMLAVILSGIELAQSALRSDPAKAKRHLANAMDGAHRAATLTARLLAFARPGPASSAAGRVEVDRLIQGMHALIGRAIDDGITLTLDLYAGDWAVQVEPAELENAILNLAINARDAMEGRGMLILATRQRTLARNEVNQCAPGDYVEIAISDTGCGMTAEVRERAFEPFFTTKPVGKGTGLGLAQIFSLVRAARGEIEILSVPGEGTTIRLLLPQMIEAGQAPAADVAAPTGEPASDEEVARPASGHEGELVLVVEDDPRVLRATLASLTALGYRGLSCNHPRKAARLLARHPETALILTDVLMPDMTGPEMVAALGSDQRGLPIVFVTGFAGDEEEAALIAGAPILRKPFTQAQLAHAIETALGEARQAPPPAAAAG